MPETISRKITELLLKNSLMSQEELEKAVLQMREEGVSLRSILLNSRKIAEKEWMGLVSQEFGIPSLNLSKYKIDPAVFRVIPEEIAKKNHLVAVSKLGETLVVAIVDPPDVMVLDDLKRISGCRIELALASQKDIEQAWEKCYGDSSQKLARIIEEAEESPRMPNEESFLEVVKEEIFAVDSAQQSAPIIRLVDTLITEGLKRRASDIHIEPYESQLRVRYRVDGRLQETNVLPKKIQNAVLARLKLMSGMDITENRVPQDGRFKIRFQNREIDFRVSVLPVSNGGKMVMRVLDRENLTGGLGPLGLDSQTLALFENAIRRPFGMILVTGPTGSGKTTTLYSILSQLNVSERNIITIEDPVEYQIDGITQIQTKSEIGLTFASGLRSILRQSPDVVMVGEIRDFETADIAIKASLTGQLVLSTLHTNDASGAMTRLMDMGVEPFLIASSVILVAAQRLCRKICLGCKQPIQIGMDKIQRMGVDPAWLKSAVLYSGKGCSRCLKTGYQGRTAVMELLAVDDRIRERIISRSSADEIKKSAIQTQGMRILREDGLQKCIQGITTLQEVVEVTAEE